MFITKNKLNFTASEDTKELALAALQRNFPSVKCHRSAIPIGYPVDKFGYLLVDEQYLVPFSFIYRLAEEMHSYGYEYGETASAREMVSDAFLLTLDENEQKILGPCLLTLIKEGWLQLSFPNATSNEDDIY